jgi:hypothetical protein
MDRFRHIGCIACWLLGQPMTPYDVQHLLSGGVRRGHMATIPLCPAHHRGVNFSPSLHLASVARGPKTFREVFGSDDELLSLAERLIAIRERQCGIRNIPEAERNA